MTMIHVQRSIDHFVLRVFEKIARRSKKYALARLPCVRPDSGKVRLDVAALTNCQFLVACVSLLGHVSHGDDFLLLSQCLIAGCV